MKRLTKLIIITFLFISIINTTNAKEGLVEGLLDIPTGIEKLDIELPKIKYIYLKDEETRLKFEIFIQINEILKSEIIKKYESGDFSYYQTKGIITNYKNFVYYTNKYFLLLSIKESGVDYGEIDYSILNTAYKIRSYYKRVQVLVNKK